MEKQLSRTAVFSVIDSERDYQEKMGDRETRPDMVETLSVGDTLSAIRYNLNKAEENWYHGSAPHEGAMDFLRKIAGLTVQAGENFGMPLRKPDTYLRACQNDSLSGCVKGIDCNCR